MNPMEWVGFGFQVLGLIVAGWGIRVTWTEYPDSTTFWDPLLGWLRAAGRWLGRLFGRRGGATVEPPIATQRVGGWAVTGDVVSVPPLPEGADLDQLREAMDERLQYLAAEVQEARVNHAIALAARDQEMVFMKADLDDRFTAVRAMIHGVARDGLRLQTLGLGSVALGLVFQALGA